MEDQSDILFDNEYIAQCFTERCSFCGKVKHVSKLKCRGVHYACDSRVCSDALYYYGDNLHKLEGMIAFCSGPATADIAKKYRRIHDIITRVQREGPAREYIDLKSRVLYRTSYMDR